MKLWFSLLRIVPNCNCSDWSFPCQVAVPGCTFLESSCQNSSAISRNDARKNKYFLLMSLRFLKSGFWNVPVPLYLGQDKLKFSGVWFVKKRYAFFLGGYFHTSVKMQVKTVKFYGLKAPTYPQVSDCP